jgi:hypothetical protein
VAFGDETYKLNLINYNYNYDSYTTNLVGRSFGRCLRNSLLSGCSMRFTTRSFGCTVLRAVAVESLAHDSERTLVCAEYGYPNGSPTTNS